MESALLTKGANSGPMKTVVENTAMANPRVSLLNMSAKAAATTAKGHEPNRPPKKREIMSVCKSLATAVAMANMEKPRAPMTSGMRLPYSSEKGAHL